LQPSGSLGDAPTQPHVVGKVWHVDVRRTFAADGIGDVVAVAGLDVLDRRRVHLASDYASDDAVVAGVDGGLGAVLQVGLDQNA
jgi:hypothetical protein